MNAIVGYTGFVGSNLYSPDRFQAAYNSKNIESAYDTKPDLLVYAGIRAEKYLANNEPEKDLKNIEQAEKNIERINPQRLILISTIDVFKTPVGVDETTEIDTKGLHPYGYNRYLLEQWVRDRYPDALIVRLPGLFGKNLKKNFIFDYINVIPSMLKAEKFVELSERDSRLKKYYTDQGNGFWKAIIPDNEKETVKGIFANLGFSALNFTDSRSKFQFYNLGHLWDDLQIAMKNDLRLLHLATEPVKISELYQYLTGKEFVNELRNSPANYDFRTYHCRCFAAESCYLYSKEAVMQEIKEFVES